MSKSADKWKLLAFVAITILIAYLLIENNRKDKKIKELKKDIEENEDLTKEIKLKLTELIQNNADVEPKIATELGEIASLIEIKQNTTAVFKLAKIIENLLKELYKSDPELNDLAKTHGRRNPSFSDYLDHAKSKGTISNEDFHQISVLKIIRNEEAHELNVRKDKSRIVSSFICGVSIVLALCKTLKRTTL